MAKRELGRTNKNSCGATPPHHAGLNKPVARVLRLWNFNAGCGEQKREVHIQDDREDMVRCAKPWRRVPGDVSAASSLTLLFGLLIRKCSYYSPLRSKSTPSYTRIGNAPAIVPQRGRKCTSRRRLACVRRMTPRARPSGPAPVPQWARPWPYDGPDEATGG